MILAVNNLSKSYDGIDILKSVSFHIEANDKLAVTGINGAGKTTLLKQIIGEERPDAGSITIPKDVRIGYLSQHALENSENTVYEEVLSVKRELINIEAELRSLEARMHAELPEAELQDVYNKYAALSHKFELDGGYAVQSNVNGILKGLGFSEDEFDKKVSVLSGGQKTRLSLGCLLLDGPEILILDEPTNHLDISSVTWLESYLRAWKGAVVIVSHDRYFLDRIVNKVLDIENGTGRLYLGNYSAFAEKKAALRKDMMRAYLNNQAELKHQQEVIDKLKQFNREKSIKRAESREKALAKMERLAKPFDVDDAMKLHFTPSKLSGKDVLYAEDLSKAFGQQLLFSGVELDVKRGEKLAIIGPNGTGKTTLLKMINGLEEPDSGEIEFGTRVEPAYYDQEHQVLDPDNTVFDEISDAYPYMNNTEIRNILASFLFTGEDVFKYIRDLSGGEKGRVSLAKLMLSKANLLLLDEPTNHLDITSKEILEEAVRNYEGTVIYVSHDRYFINRTATRILELDHTHFVNYVGNYDYYLEKQADPSFDKAKSVSGRLHSDAGTGAGAGLGAAFVGAGNGTGTDASGGRGVGAGSSAGAGYSGLSAQNSAQGNNSSETTVNNLSYKEQKERKQQLQKLRTALSNCEKAIAEHEEKIAGIDELISIPENAVNSAKLNELTGQQNKLNEELEELYMKWEELSEEVAAFE
ncbi:MAG: ABC-F family ATP-binding cassette domain-containing protein [Eubacteriales bacterium]|nr:ABC-F family ATP-binding cassette domain-containing protein [Eubacteriales bacterium]